MNGQAPNASLAAARNAYLLFLNRTGGQMRPEDLQRLIIGILEAHYDLTRQPKGEIVNLVEQAAWEWEETP